MEKLENKEQFNTLRERYNEILYKFLAFGCFVLPIFAYVSDKDIYPGGLSNPVAFKRLAIVSLVCIGAFLAILVGKIYVKDTMVKSYLSLVSVIALFAVISNLYLDSMTNWSVVFVLTTALALFYYKSFIIIFCVASIICLIPTFQYTMADANFSTFANGFSVFLRLMLIILNCILVSTIAKECERTLNKSFSQVNEIDKQNIVQRNIFKNIKENSELLKDTSDSIMESIATSVDGLGKIAENSHVIMNSSYESRKSIENIDSKAEDIKSNINKVYDYVQETNEFAEEINKISTVNKINTNEMEILIEEIKESINETNEYMMKILSSSQNINSMSLEISDVANQTNMLSLNANIEAARAGIHGKGFMVVANEVGKLADISKTLSTNIINVTSENSAIVKETSESVLKTVEKINKSVEFLKEITESSEILYEKSNKNMDEIKSLSSYLKTQVDAIEDIKNNISVAVDCIVTQSSLIEDNSASIEEINASTQEIGAALEGLHEIITNLNGNFN